MVFLKDDFQVQKCLESISMIFEKYQVVLNLFYFADGTIILSLGIDH